MKIKNRNGMIELLRFIACIGIALYHFEWLYIKTPIYFTHLYILVEFYFIISGFFLALEACKDNSRFKSGLNYAFSQLKKLYSLYIISFLVTFIIINHNIDDFSIWLVNLWDAKWEILLFQTFSFGNKLTYNLGGAPDFISALLFASMILFHIINKNKELFKNVIGPMIIVFGIGFIINKYGNLSQWNSYNLFFSSGLLRALYNMSVGAWFYMVVFPKLKELKSYKLIFLEFLFIISLIAIILLRNYINYNDLILYIFIFAFGISINSTINIKNNIINKFCCLLGTFSYPIFLFHYIVIYLMNNYLPNLTYNEGIIFLIISLLIISIIISLLITLLTKILKLFNKKTL